MIDQKKVSMLLRSAGRLEKRIREWVNDHPVNDSDTTNVIAHKVADKFLRIYNMVFAYNQLNRGASMVESACCRFPVTESDIINDLEKSCRSAEEHANNMIAKLVPDLEVYLEILSKFLKNGTHPLLSKMEI